MTHEDTLDRFRDAQRRPGSGFDAALAEIRAGQKRGHWIWYVFPQLAGLGRSAMSEAYAIRDVEEADAYLRDPLLGQRLVTITEAVCFHLRQGVPLAQVMGSGIDATKLVSSLTLFGGAAARCPSGQVPAADALRPLADELLTAAEHAGYPACTFTARHLTRAQAG